MSSLKPTDVKKKLFSRSKRVKCVDMHPFEPWVIASLYTGQVVIYNYKTGAIVNTIDVVDHIPIRAVRFISRQEQIIRREAHQDFIRAIAVHDSLPIILTASDDMTIKAWDWTKTTPATPTGWTNIMMYEGHTHYVMAVAFHPRDPSVFASASLDDTVRVWSLQSPTPKFTLTGHTGHVTCVAFYPRGDRPYLISGSDDRTFRVWDLQTKAMVAVSAEGRPLDDAPNTGVSPTTQGHSRPLTSVLFHPDLPLIITASEDESAIIWDLATFKPLLRLAFGMERVWTLAACPGRSNLALGCDQGTIVLSLRGWRPVRAMDQNGLVFFTSSSSGGPTEVFSVNVRSTVDRVVDGERIVAPSKERGTLEHPPKRLLFNSTGQYLTVVTDSEYTVMTSLTFKPTRYYGPATDFAWSHDPSQFAVLRPGPVAVIFKGFKERQTVQLPPTASALFGGPLLGVRCEGGVEFYDWDTGAWVQTINPAPRDVIWARHGRLVAVLFDTNTYLLRYDSEAAREVADAVAAGQEAPEAERRVFTVFGTHEERSKGGCWVAWTFVTLTVGSRLVLLTGATSEPHTVVDRRVSVLGYLEKEQRVYLVDSENEIISYKIPFSVLEFRASVLRGNVDEAMDKLLPYIPRDQLLPISKFLAAENRPDLALRVCPDPDFKFELAVQVGDLDTAAELVRSAAADAKAAAVAALSEDVPPELAPSSPTGGPGGRPFSPPYVSALRKLLDSPKVSTRDGLTALASKWRLVGDLALRAGRLDLAATAFREGGDFASELLIAGVVGDESALRDILERARAAVDTSTAFHAAYLLHDWLTCLDILKAADRISEALLFARSYAPEHAAGLVPLLQTQLRSLGSHGAALAERIADPATFPNLFSDTPAVIPRPPADETKGECEEAPVVSSEGDAGAISEQAEASPIRSPPPQPQAGSPAPSPSSPGRGSASQPPASPSPSPPSAPPAPIAPSESSDTLGFLGDDPARSDAGSDASAPTGQDDIDFDEDDWKE